MTTQRLSLRDGVWCCACCLVPVRQGAAADIFETASGEINHWAWCWMWNKVRWAAVAAETHRLRMHLGHWLNVPERRAGKRYNDAMRSR